MGALPASVRTLPQLFAWRVAATPRTEAYRQFNPQTNAWVSSSWAEAGARVAHWTEALTRLGLPRGARIAILLPNGLDAICIDQAALALACVPVPLHAIDNPQSIAYILGDSDASLLVAASDTQWQAIASVGLALPALRQVVVAQQESRASSDIAIPPVLPLSQWLSPPANALAASTSAPAPPTEDDLAALVYTSGTTGKPKGVMLTHANVVANVRAVLDRVAPLASDVFLSFLPLSHTFERTGGYYLPIAAGACVAYARSVALLAEDLKTVRPTILISVPRIYERVHGKLQEMLAVSRLKSRLFEWAVAVGWRRFCRQQGLPLEDGGWQVLDDLAWCLLGPLVARPLLAQFGGRLRVAVSGGAPLSQPIARCFLGLGLPILQGYGMTETSPVVAVNAPDDNDPATVGRPLVGVQVRIGENLELQVRGPSVMRGYWKREEDSARLHRGLAAHRRPGRHRGRAHPHFGPPEGDHRHLDRRKDCTGRPGTGDHRRSAVRTSLCLWRQPALHRLHRGAEPRGMGTAGREPATRRLIAGKPGRQHCTRGRTGAHPVTDTWLSVLCAAARRVPDTGAVDAGKHHDDAHAQDQAQQPGGALRHADRRAVPALINVLVNANQGEPAPSLRAQPIRAACLRPRFLAALRALAH